MHRTPSPPRRVRTPPAPLHGDNYDLLSPRRSTRLAAQRDGHANQEQTTPRARRDITPTPSSQRLAPRASPFALSPPSSPMARQLTSPRSTRRAYQGRHLPDSDSDQVAPSSARRLRSVKASDMLPTPSKTPRKQRMEEMGSAARVLFPSRPATIDEVVPTPRKSRKPKMLCTLESFAEHVDHPAESIPIYTDSKERLPTPSLDHDNPFLTKKGKGRAKPSSFKLRNPVDSKTQKMNEAVDRDQGMVYMFRGRKVYRKFHDSSLSKASEAGEKEEQEEEEEEEEGLDELSDDDRRLRRHIGHEARRPLTRSTLKPRVLFQEEIRQRNRDNGAEEDDEEAITDVEVSLATPSRRKIKASAVEVAALPTSPPSTAGKVKKQISFNSWTRVKSAHGSSSSPREIKKRSGERLEHDANKRVRSEHSASSMSLDNL